MPPLYTVCARDCYDTCSMLARTNLDNAVSLHGDSEHPITQGFLCPRGNKDMERVARNRVLYPHVRNAEKPGRQLTRSAWDQALSLVAGRLSETLSQHGPSAVLYLKYSGNTGLLANLFPQRLWTALAATRSDNSLCSKSGHAALRLHYGASYGLDPDELRRQKLVVWWGFNPAVSSPHMWALALKARRDMGARIVVVDSRRSETSKQADLWLQPRPGSDVALAYGVATQLFAQQLIDRAFVDEWTTGVEEFAAESAQWTPERVSQETGIAAEQVATLASWYAGSKPSATMIGIGMQKAREGAESVRAISLLPALVGLHRGFFYSNSAAHLVDEDYLTGHGITAVQGETVSQVGLGRLLAEGRFRFIFIAHMNPALSLPEQNLVRKGMCRKDVFVVVHDPHWTETCDFADVVLPAQSYLEKEDVVVPWTHCYVRKSERVLAPAGESRHEITVMTDLARLLKRQESWLFADPWQELAKALGNAFEHDECKTLFAGRQLRLQRRRPDVYPTSSGKIEFASRLALQQGFNPLPAHISCAPAANRFTLINSALSHYTHSQFQDIYGPLPAIVAVNPQDASRLGIAEQNEVELYNQHGCIRLRAKIDDQVPLGVLWSPKEHTGLCGNPQNVLLPGDHQRLGNGSLFNSITVALRAIARQPSTAGDFRPDM